MAKLGKLGTATYFLSSFISLLDFLLFFRSADRQRTNTPAQQHLQLAQKAVNTQRPSRMRARSQTINLRIRHTVLKLLSPSLRRDHIVPAGQIQHLISRPVIDVRRSTRPLVTPRLPAQPRANGI